MSLGRLIQSLAVSISLTSFSCEDMSSVWTVRLQGGQDLGFQRSKCPNLANLRVSHVLDLNDQ